MLKAMDHAKHSIKKIESPVLALQATDDKRLSRRGLKFIRRHVTSEKSQVKILPFGSHVLTRGEAKGEVFNRIHDFLEGI